jgi:GNAT superfamily N-acetyltransferase
VDVLIREADEGDIADIRGLFRETYGDDYAFPQFFDRRFLAKQIYSDDCLMLVAEDPAKNRIVGTGSVVFDVGAFADLVGEFGRLVVHPNARGRGIASRLMQGRLARVDGHLHVGLADNRVEHPFSQKLSLKHGFAPVGYLPIHNGEPVALFARHFNDSLQLRRNHPHVAPQVYWLAYAAMRNLGLSCDAIVDESAAAYPNYDDFELEELTANGYASLLRFERGRLRNRDIFGPVKLDLGVRKLQRHNTNYLLARRGGQLMGAIGYALDANIDNAVRIFELIHLNEQPVRFLLNELERRCLGEWGVDYIETDVSADAPRMQKTLLQLGFLPIAYVPAGVFYNVERLDTVRMARYHVPVSKENLALIDSMKPIAEGVIERFNRQWTEPLLVNVLPQMPIFGGLNSEQTARLANLFRQVTFETGDWIARQGHRDGKAYILVSGSAEIMFDDDVTADVIRPGEFLGELSLLNRAAHSAGIRALEHVEAAVIEQIDLDELLRLRGDIGCVLYRNLATGLGVKLKRTATDCMTSDRRQSLYGGRLTGRR